MSDIRNAIIESAVIDIGEKGLLTAWIFLDYGGAGQGFGGYALHLPEDWAHHTKHSPYAGHFLMRSMEVAGVGQWDKLPGKTVRAKIVDGKVAGIGHIVKDDWFCPAEDFKEYVNED
jgi:hypothetical protein